MSKDNEHQQHLHNTKAKLDSVSSSFCVAKWKQVTMHLQNGLNHSWHHPKPHVVPVAEIKFNPTALHTINSTLIVRPDHSLTQSLTHLIW